MKKTRIGKVIVCKDCGSDNIKKSKITKFNHCVECCAKVD